MQHSEVRIVKGVDDRLTGEAYVHISGARAKLRLALSKDRTLMPVCSPRLKLSLPSAAQCRPGSFYAGTALLLCGGCLQTVMM